MDNPKAHEQTRQTEAEGLYGGLEGWLPRVGLGSEEPYKPAEESRHDLWVDSGRLHAKEYFPELLLPVSLSPR